MAKALTLVAVTVFCVLVAIEPVSAARICGALAEHPGACTGRARGYTAILEPLGLSSVEDIVSGRHCFEGIPLGEYRIIVPQGCGHFGCWEPETPLVVSAEDEHVWFEVEMVSPHTGSCGGFTVHISDLVRCVSIALGDGPLESCYACDGNRDGSVTVDELIEATENALVGFPPPC